MASPGSPNILFVFGPSQSFVAYIPGIYNTSTNLSPEITALLSTENIKFLNFVAFPSSTSLSTSGLVSHSYIGYHKKHGLKTAGFLHSSHETCDLTGFENWIKSLEKKTEGVEVVCDSTGGIWARMDCKKGVKWFDDGLPLETRQWLKKNSMREHGLCPTCVALGKGDAYIIVWEDGHVVWDLKGLYDSLDKKLTTILATSKTLSYAALNPYQEDSYFCIFDDSSCLFQFPETDDFKTLETLIQDGVMRVIIDSPTLRQSTDAVKVADEKEGDGNQKDGFAKTVMEKAAEQVAEKNLEQNWEALMENL